MTESWAHPVTLELHGGGTVDLRPIEPADADALVAFHARLSPGTVYRRFFSAHPVLSEKEVERFTTVDHVNRQALVAFDGDDLVAVGRYDRLASGTEAEVAFVVQDGYQGQGIGTELLRRLAAAAREQGIGRLVADTMIDNRHMLDVFRHAGFREVTNYVDGLVHVVLEIDPEEAAR